MKNLYWGLIWAAATWAHSAAPYMHDGSVKTLADAIDHNGKGGRADHPNRSGFVKQIDLSAAEREDLIQFRLSLTDRKLLTNPQLTDPRAPSPPLTKPIRA